MRLTSPDNPRIRRIVQLRRSRDRRREGVFLAEGLREVARAIAAGLRLRELYVCPDLLLASAGQVPGADVSDALIHEVTPALMKRMAYLDEPEGVLAVFDEPAWRLEGLTTNGVDLWLVAVGLEKPGNLGAMARSVAAAGASGLLVADAQVDPFNPNAIRASTGAVFGLPVACAPSSQILAFLRGRNVRPIVAMPQAGTAYTAADLRGPVALVIGAEDRGVDEFWRDAGRELGECVAIPMAQGVVDSLNASVTAGILLFEALRQRGGQGNERARE